MKYLCLILVLTSVICLLGCENGAVEPPLTPQDDKMPINTPVPSANLTKDEVIGEWLIDTYYAIDASTGKEYSLQNLYGTGIKHGGVLIFRADGTFSKYIGVFAIEERSYQEGKFDIINGVIQLKFEGGRVDEAVYISETKKIEYHRSGDDYFPPIYEYYMRK